jgi:hypothetical protein
MGNWEYNGSFLEQFDGNSRGFVTNLFCWAYRKDPHGVYLNEDQPQARSVAEMLTRLKNDIAERLSRDWISDNQNRTLKQLEAIFNEPETAQFAAHIFQREQIDPNLKMKLKEQNAQVYVQKAMSSKPPSIAQMKFLKSLGYNGPDPTSMFEASRLIEQQKKKAA